MAKVINIFLIMSGRVIPMCQGEDGLYYYSDEGWALCFHEQYIDGERGAEIDVYTETIAEITFYDPEFFLEMNEFVQEYYSPIYLKAVTDCFKDKWGRMYVFLS